MTIPSPVLVKMATLGLTADQAEAVAAMLSAVEVATREEGEPGKEKARARWRKWREDHPANVSKRLLTTANDSKRLVHGDAPVEDNSLTQKKEPRESKKEQSAQARLEVVLDADHAKAFVDHRQRLRKPLTGYAAKLLAGKLAKFPDPNAEVDKIIERGWQTVYEDDRPQSARASPKPPPPPQLSDVFALIANEISDESELRYAKGVSGSRQAIPDLSIVRSGR